MAKITKEDVIGFIENMSVLELSDLVKELEEKFGVSAAAMSMAMAAPAAAAGEVVRRGESIHLDVAAGLRSARCGTSIGCGVSAAHRGQVGTQRVVALVARREAVRIDVVASGRQRRLKHRVAGVLIVVVAGHLRVRVLTVLANVQRAVIGALHAKSDP